METVGLQQHRMRVSVPDHRNVDVVGGAAACQHGVELLPGFLAGHQAVHGVRDETPALAPAGDYRQRGRLPVA